MEGAAAFAAAPSSFQPSPREEGFAVSDLTTPAERLPRADLERLQLERRGRIEHGQLGGADQVIADRALDARRHRLTPGL